MAKTIRADGQLEQVYTVSAHVGPGQTNNPTDVELVQFLIVESLKLPNTLRIKKPPPAITRTFDTITGFWIFEIQASIERSGLSHVVDGIISPARGQVYSGHDIWTIVGMCRKLSQSNHAKYMGIPANPTLSGTLQAELQLGL